MAHLVIILVMIAETEVIDANEDEVDPHVGRTATEGMRTLMPRAVAIETASAKIDMEEPQPQ